MIEKKAEKSKNLSAARPPGPDPAGRSQPCADAGGPGRAQPTSFPALRQAGAVARAPSAHPRMDRHHGLAIGGSNQNLFLIAALFAGHDGSPGQGSAAVPLLIVGLLLSLAAAPGWTELVLLSPNRVGGIAAACMRRSVAIVRS